MTTIHSVLLIAGLLMVGCQITLPTPVYTPLVQLNSNPEKISSTIKINVSDGRIAGEFTFYKNHRSDEAKFEDKISTVVFNAIEQELVNFGFKTQEKDIGRADYALNCHLQNFEAFEYRGIGVRPDYLIITVQIEFEWVDLSNGKILSKRKQREQSQIETGYQPTDVIWDKKSIERYGIVLVNSLLPKVIQEEFRQIDFN